MSGKARYTKQWHKCRTCITTEDLTMYRGHFYCEECFKQKNKKQFADDQEYAQQLRKHMLKN